MADEYESTLDEKKFSESLSRALTVIESGIKTGADNLELILDKQDLFKLGPMTDILNRCEIEYRQGKRGKIDALKEMLRNYETSSQPEDQKGLKNLFGKCQEIESIHGAYVGAEGWITYLNFGRYREATPPTDDELAVAAMEYLAGLTDDNKLPETVYVAHFNDDKVEPPSTTKAKYFHSTKEIRDLNDRLENEIHHVGGKKWQKIDVKEGHRKDLMKLKEISADKFAYTRTEILGMLDLYNPTYK